MSPTWLVARREIVERGRDRTFLIGLLVTLALVLGFAIIPGLVGDDTETVSVGVVGDQAKQVVAAAAPAAPALDLKLVARDVPDRATAERLLRDEDVDLAVVGEAILVRDDPSQDAARLLQTAAVEIRRFTALTEAGVSPESARTILGLPPPTVQTVDPAAAERTSREALAFVGTILLFVSILGFAIMVAFGVVEEKSTRVVEVLLSAVRPRHLLAGKVIGLAVLGLIQLVAIAVPGIIAARLSGTLELPASESPGQIVVLVVWFLIGFAVYAAAFAAAATLVSRQEDLQSAILPISLVMYGAFFVGLASLNEPSGTLARVFSFIPPIAPMVVPNRFALREISLGEQALAAVVSIAGAVLLVLLAARIYERSVLRMGARVPWREALRRS